MGNNHLKVTSPDLKLNKNELDLLKNSWQILIKNGNGLSELGNGLMTRILIEYKDIKMIWRKKNTKIAEDSETMVNPNEVVRQHGEKVFNTIKLALTSLETNELNRLIDNLNQMGYEHYKYGTRLEHFNIMGEALISTFSDTLKEHWTDQTKKTWLKIFSYIEFHMKTGMNNAVEQLTE